MIAAEHTTSPTFWAIFEPRFYPLEGSTCSRAFSYYCTVCEEEDSDEEPNNALPLRSLDTGVVYSNDFDAIFLPRIQSVRDMDAVCVGLEMLLADHCAKDIKDKMHAQVDIRSELVPAFLRSFPAQFKIEQDLEIMKLDLCRDFPFDGQMVSDSVRLLHEGSYDQDLDTSMHIKEMIGQQITSSFVVESSPHLVKLSKFKSKYTGGVRCLVLSDQVAFINGAYTHPEYRGHGTFKDSLHALLVYLKNHEIITVCLDCSDENIPLWTRFKFRSMGYRYLSIAIHSIEEQ